MFRKFPFPSKEAPIYPMEMAGMTAHEEGGVIASLKGTHLQMWIDDRKHTHLEGISGRLGMATASLATGGEGCSQWTSGNRYDGPISSKARASDVLLGRACMTAVPCGSSFMTLARPGTYRKFLGADLFWTLFWPSSTSG